VELLVDVLVVVVLWNPLNIHPSLFVVSRECQPAYHKAPPVALELLISR
jgi:hypothetical protein